MCGVGRLVWAVADKSELVQLNFAENGGFSPKTRRRVWWTVVKWVLSPVACQHWPVATVCFTHETNDH